MHTMTLPIPTTYEYYAELTAAIELAQKAGDLLLEIHQTGPTQIRRKQSAVDIVTEADTASQALILAGITERFPQHDIMAEEAGWDKDTGARALWVVDPLDGTANFANRFPIFAVSIALWIDDRPTIGVVQDVVRERTYWAARGRGAWAGPRGRLDESELHVSQARDLNPSIIATGFPYVRATTQDNNRAECSYLIPRMRGMRRAGSAALDLAWVAEGRLDGYWEAYIHPWDWGAGVLLITEAGGIISDYAGASWQTEKNQMIAANPYLHEKLLNAVQMARQQAGFD